MELGRKNQLKRGVLPSTFDHPRVSKVAAYTVQDVHALSHIERHSQGMVRQLSRLLAQVRRPPSFPLANSFACAVRHTGGFRRVSHASGLAAIP